MARSVSTFFASSCAAFSFRFAVSMPRASSLSDARSCRFGYVTADQSDGSAVPIDVHLMVEPVDALAQAFAKAGADVISFHPGASAHVDRTLQLIKDAGCQAGLVFNPAASLDVLEWEMDRLDLVLVMSVNPGFGGQSFIPEALEKLRALRARIDKLGRKIDLEVDGGINEHTARAAIAAGADVLVAGTATFNGGANAYAGNIRLLRGGGS